jgi:hypothetical protein
MLRNPPPILVVSVRRDRLPPPGGPFAASWPHHTVLAPSHPAWPRHTQALIEVLDVSSVGLSGLCHPLPARCGRL